MNTRVVCGEPEMYSESAIDVELRFAIEIAIEMWDAVADCPMNDYFYGLLLLGELPPSSSPAMLDQRLRCVTNRVPASIMLFADEGVQMGGKRLPGSGSGSGTVCGTCTVHVSKFLFAQHSTEKGAASCDKLAGGWTDGRAGGWSVKVLLWNVTHVTKAECEKLVQTMRPSMVGKLAAPK